MTGRSTFRGEWQKGVAAAVFAASFGAQANAPSVGGAPNRTPFASTSGHIELGAGWVSNDSFKFGEYSGLTDKGLLAIAGFSVSGQSPENGGSWILAGENLGLASRSIGGEFVRPGRFRVYGEFAEMPHFRLGDARSPFNGPRTATLALPADWAPAPTTTGLSKLDASLDRIPIKTTRTKYGGGFTWQFKQNWEWTGRTHIEERSGTRATSAMFGSNAGNAVATTLPESVDSVTRESRLGLGYAGQAFQVEASYRFSQFDNNRSALTWRNPYALRTGYHPSQNFSAGGLGRLSLAPDNKAHYLSVDAGYVPNSALRVSGALSYGRLSQDDPFLPFTVNTALTVQSPLPRGSLEGIVDVFHVGLGMVFQLAPDVDLRGRYRYDSRDNRTPADIFIGVPSDSLSQGPINSARARINRPYDYSNHLLRLDGSYRSGPGTRFTLGYDFARKGRHLTAVRHTREHTARAEARSRITDTVTGWVRYSYATRDGSEYIGNRSFLAGHSPAYLATLAPDDTFENDPLMRQYDIADRTRHMARAGATVVPNPRTTLGISGAYSHANFRNTVVGLTGFGYRSVTADLSFLPRDDVQVTAFVTYERMNHDQTGYARAPGDVRPGVPRDPRAFWKVVNGDDAYSAGGHVEWTVVENTLDVAIDYALSRTIGSYDISAGALVPFLPLPDDTATLHAVGANSRYRVNDGLTVTAAYSFQRYRSRDFAVDGVSSNTIPTLLTFGEASPRHNVHVIGVSLVKSF